jgi:hypothetical protein
VKTTVGVGCVAVVLYLLLYLAILAAIVWVVITVAKEALK